VRMRASSTVFVKASRRVKADFGGMFADGTVGSGGREDVRIYRTWESETAEVQHGRMSRSVYRESTVAGALAAASDTMSKE
jgi:hypothetical protein